MPVNTISPPASPNVSQVRQELADISPQYDLIRDCLAGEVAVKAQTDKYLPRPNPTDMSPENLARYKDYLLRAVFYGVTKRTLEGMSGQVFMVDPVVQVPKLLEPVLKDANGKGVTVIQLSQEAHRLVTAYGRAGLLADHPQVEEGQTVTRQDQLEGKIRPTLSVYEPWNIINWRTKTVGGKNVLSLVVLKEIVDDVPNATDPFNTEQIEQYRVLRLDESNLYIQEIYRLEQDVKKKSKNLPRRFGKVATYEIKDASGKRLNEIPFTFIGSTDNDVNIDAPPMYDLASLNIAHYRNSADYEESVYVVGQPTLFMSGLTEDWVKIIGPVQMGSRTAIALPEGGSADLIQAEPNTLAKEAMEAKERQMVALGAKLVQQTTVQRTATEADLEEASETSMLQTITKNVSAAFKWGLEWCSIFAGATTIQRDESENSLKFELNTEFHLATASPEEVKLTIEAWQKEAITFTEMRETLKKGRVAFEDDKVAEREIEASRMNDANAVDEDPNETNANNNE